MPKIYVALIVLLVKSISISHSQEIVILSSKDKLEKNEINCSEIIKRRGEIITNINTSRVEIFLPQKEKSNGVAVLICPGGGYSGLSIVREGKEVAEWFNKIGVTAFVLYYRMPNGKSLLPLKDAQAAIRYIRRNAKKWDIKKNKVGVIGFSAGGHLASTLSTHSKRKYTPNFMILVYPVITMHDEFTHLGSRKNLLGNNPSQEMICFYSNELHVTKKTPPTFIVHAKDDPTVKWENSQLFYEKLKQQNIQTALHIYNNGKHGFGIRHRNTDSDNWTKELEDWLIKRQAM
jgi:acetyl esterase/lipase